MDRHDLVDGLVRGVHGAGAGGGHHVAHAQLVGDRGRGRGDQRVAAGDLQRLERVDGRDVALALLDHGLEVLVVDLLLLVRDLQEALVDLVKLGVGEGVAQLCQAVAQRRVAGARREDDLGAGRAHVGGVDDLIGVTGLEDAVLVDARGVREGVGAHDGLVGLDAHARDAGDEVARAGELLGHDVGVGVELLAVHLDGHDDLFERGVAGALAQAVDGALNLAGAVLDALEGKGRGHAEVVVRVHGDDDILDANDVVREPLDAPAEVLGQLVARGVRNVHDGRAGLHHGLDHALEERLVGAARVLGVELDVLHVALGVLHAVDGALDALVLGDAQLVAQVGGRDADAGVDARALGALERLGRTVDVLLDRTREAADHAVVTGDAADLLHGAEVARRGDGEAGLDDVHAHADELLGDDELLLGVHGGAGALLAVAQGGVKDVNLPGHVSAFLRCLRGGRAAARRG